MPHVNPEVAVPLQLLGHRQHHRRINLVDRTAVAADEMNMLILTRPVIGRRPVRQVGVTDQAQFLKQLKRAINRGDVDTGGTLANRVVNLLRRGMPQLMHSLQNQLALRSQPQATLPEHLGK